MDRRTVLALLATMAAAPALAILPDEAVQVREPWGRFASGPHFAAFRDAIARLKADTDPESADSWFFWANIHQAHCPHGKPTFLSWHRGYLWLFEKKLRALSGVDALRLPYWDYYADPRVPAEMLYRGMPDAPNPLWCPRRGESVAAALSLEPFGDGITGFSRGELHPFEPLIERSPHNNIHNLIGGNMASMQSPQDVLFWMHHANVDRLWTAWIAAGGGRKMPAPEAAYWDGRLDYTDAEHLDKRGMIATEALGYRYDDMALPRALPAEEPLVGAAPSDSAPRDRPRRPRTGAPPPRPVAPPPVAETAMPAMPAMGPSPTQGLLLGEGTSTVTVSIPYDEPMVSEAAPAAAPPVASAMPASPPSRPSPPDDTLTVVLDSVTLTDEGVDGGYFYKVYLDLPGADPQDREARLIGTIGPFQIAAAMHGDHGMHGGDGGIRLELPATQLVQSLAQGRDPAELGELSVSFVRVDSMDAPAGPVIGIGDFRIERTPVR